MMQLLDLWLCSEFGGSKLQKSLQPPSLWGVCMFFLQRLLFPKGQQTYRLNVDSNIPVGVNKCLSLGQACDNLATCWANRPPLPQWQLGERLALTTTGNIMQLFGNLYLPYNAVLFCQVLNMEKQKMYFRNLEELLLNNHSMQFGQQNPLKAQCVRCTMLQHRASQTSGTNSFFFFQLSWLKLL